jgi:hypothetical protein
VTTQLTTTPTVAVPGPLCTPVQLGVTVSTLRTGTASHAYEIRRLLATNVAKTAGVTITVYIVEDGGSVTDANTFVKTVAVPSDGVPYRIEELEGMQLGGGWTLQALASVATAITVGGSGIDRS